MNYSALKKTVFDFAAKKGLKEFELFGQDGKEFEINIRGGKIENYKDASFKGAGFKTVVNGKAGYSFTEVYEKNAAEKMVKDAIENLQLIDAEDAEFIYSGGGDYLTVEPYQNTFDTIPVERKIRWAITLEERALKYDKAIVNIPYCQYFDQSTTISISNSFGVNLSHKNGGGGMVVMVGAADGEKIKSGFDFRIEREPSKLDPEALAESASKKALEKFGAKSLPSAKYTALFDPRATGELLGLLTVMINAERVQQGFSPLAKLYGKKVFSDLISFVDDPNVPGSLFNTPFDAQGVPTRRKHIIKSGILETYLHHLKTANKAAIPSTGNAARGKYNQTLSIAPQNLILVPGQCNFKELTAKIDKGIIVTSLQGMHSGANPFSGQFSLGAEGFFVENGAISRPVEQITVAGNFLEVFNRILEVGSDTETLFSELGHGLYSPSILVADLDVAGE